MSEIAWKQYTPLDELVARRHELVKEWIDAATPARA
jgi:hypothetical protein